MLSAFAHQIQELDKKVSQQESQLTDVKNHLSESNSTNPECQCQPALTNLQSQVDSNHFRLNDLTAKFQQLQTADSYGSPMCSDLSDSGPFYEDVSHPRVDSGWRAPGSRGPTPSCLPDGYESPPPSGIEPSAPHSNLRYSAKEFFAAASFANSEPDNKMMHSPSPGNSPPKKCNPWLVDNAKIREPPAGQVRSTKACVGPAPGISVENITHIAGENSSLKQQILAYRKKVCDLEEKVRQAEASVGDVRVNREQVVKQEREWGQRQEWYEHKLKLLKQDKRRRGETIGKLLKCLDDLKESGRLDESRVRDGRSVLAATLGSRGMQAEERVCRVVEAVEYDRVPRTPPPAVESADPVSAAHSTACFPDDGRLPVSDCCSGNQNKNNSAFFGGIGGVSSETTQMCGVQSDRLAERHGFRPIEGPRYEDMEMI